MLHSLYACRQHLSCVAAAESMYQSDPAALGPPESRTVMSVALRDIDAGQVVATFMLPRLEDGAVTHSLPLHAVLACCAGGRADRVFLSLDVSDDKVPEVHSWVACCAMNRCYTATACCKRVTHEHRAAA
jgi:hypothetical protein